MQRCRPQGPQVSLVMRPQATRCGTVSKPHTRSDHRALVMGVLLVPVATPHDVLLSGSSRVASQSRQRSLREILDSFSFFQSIMQSWTPRPLLCCTFLLLTVVTMWEQTPAECMPQNASMVHAITGNGSILFFAPPPTSTQERVGAASLLRGIYSLFRDTWKKIMEIGTPASVGCKSSAVRDDRCAGSTWTIGVKGPQSFRYPSRCADRQVGSSARLMVVELRYGCRKERRSIKNVSLVVS